jgi:hypothetical protein
VSLWVVVVIAVVLAAVVALLAAPLRARGPSAGAAESVRSDDPAGPRSSERADLEAAREAKYREIRDAELDYRTGKLSEEDYRAVDAALRAEAIEILRRLEAEE